MKKNLLLFSFYFICFSLVGFSENENKTRDTSKISRFIEGGNFHLQGRTFFMVTDNAGTKHDYYALAAGIGVTYETASLKGFQGGIGGFFMYNIASSYLGNNSSTGIQNRYEVGLFDIRRPTYRKDLNRLEQLYLKYSYKKSFAQVGKIILNTPFINKQDGRMRPTAESGLWLECNEIKNLKLEGGWLWGISPRSTIKWFSMANSVGIYPSGVSTFGIKSYNPGGITSKGVGIIGATYKWKNYSFQYWDNFFENVMNTTLLQAETGRKISEKLYWSRI